jgi:hypothetical protein
MRNVARYALTLLVAPLLAGCFTSQISLYEGVKPLQPFRDGAVFTTANGDKSEHTTAHEVSPDAYRFVVEGDEKSSANQEPFHFFALPGAPDGTMVVEWISNGYCPSPKSATDKTCQFYVYDLWRLTHNKLGVTNPDCSKMKEVEKLPGVKVDGENCIFTRRATLERALRMVVAAHLKPDNVLTVSQ